MGTGQKVAGEFGFSYVKPSSGQVWFGYNLDGPDSDLAKSDLLQSLDLITLTLYQELALGLTHLL